MASCRTSFSQDPGPTRRWDCGQSSALASGELTCPWCVSVAQDREFFELFGIRTTVMVRPMSERTHLGLSRCRRMVLMRWTVQEMYYVTEAAGPVAFFPFRQNDAMEPDGTAVPSLNVGVADGQLHISGPSVRTCEPHSWVLLCDAFVGGAKRCQ